MEAKTDSLQRLAQMTRGISAGGVLNDATDATAGGASDGAHFDCAPTAGGPSFVKLEDARLIKTEESLQIDPLKGVSPSSAAACAVATATDGALYQSAGATAAGFQPAWPNFYYQQLAHSSAAAFNAAAMCSWPNAAQPQQSAVVHCSANSFPVYAPNPKKGRQTYTRQQTMQLEDRFRENKYVTRKLRDQLRAATDLNDRQIKIWFQNRRMKEKKENQRRDNGENEHTPLNANPPPGGATSTAKMAAMLPTAAECAAAAAANAMLHVHHPTAGSMSHGQQRLAPHQHHLMTAAAVGEMSPVSLHKNLVSLSLNGLSGGNGGDNALLSIGDAATTSSASSSVTATAAVANFAAGLAGGLMPPHHNPGLINAHHQMQQYLPQFDELTDILEDDKKHMSAFGMLPNPSGQHPMTAAAMWTSINGGNAMMMPAMSTASTPMSSSSGSGSTPFGTAGLTAAMLGGEPTLAPWLTPHQLAPHTMPAGMMHAAVASANNSGFGVVNGGGSAAGNYAYSLYPTNV